MKILLVSPFFYPQNVIAVSRVGQWTKYLSRLGHDVTVLTTKKYPFWPLDYNVELPANVKIVEVDFLPYLVKKLLGFSGAQKMSVKDGAGSVPGRSGILRDIKSKITRYFDPHDLWIRPASKVGSTLSRKIDFDLIISSYSPAAAHHVARNIKIKSNKSVWIADFRDLWAKNHLISRGYFGRLLEGTRENFCIKHADILVTISKPLADVLKESYLDKKVEVIPNGYDPEDYPELGGLSDEEINVSQQVVISYTGMIYEGKRDPSPLLLAINDLIDSGEVNKNIISVNFYGPSKAALNKIINSRDFNRHKFINVFDQVSRDQSIAIQKESDILLLLEWSDESSRGVLTGKLFEYLVSGRPILGVGVHPDSEAGLLIARAQAGLVSSDVDVIKNLLKKYIFTRNFESFQPRIEEIKKYSRDQQVLTLIGMLENINEHQQ